MSNVLFITGIDTDIGKTVATGLYAKRLMSQGFSVITQKWIQTGCTDVSSDILTHRTLQNIALTNDDHQGTTCPYILPYPASPHLAAQMAGVVIDPLVISSATQTLKSHYDYVLIEGAGGLCVPYDDTNTALDYIAQAGYPVVLVTSGRLGSINHTLLSLMACRTHHLDVACLIYNTFGQTDPLICQNTKHYLKQYVQTHFKEAQFFEMKEWELIES